MAIISGAAKVITTERDLSARIGATRGAYGAMVLPAVAGPLQPRLVTTPEQFLRYYTPKGQVELGYDEAYFQALTYLQYSNKLWIVRAQANALHGGYFLRAATATTASNGEIEFGLSSITDYDITTENGLPTGTPSAAGEEKAVLFYAANPGAWNNEIRIRVSTDVAVVKEPNAFLLEVFNGTTRVESFIVSRDPTKKNLRGQNIFVETVLENQSRYVRALTNPVVAATVQPKPTGNTPVALGKGTNGDAVTDAEMITALNQLRDPSLYRPVIVFDGGWTTQAYHSALIEFCEERGDCAFILSVPFDLESAANYITEIVTYKTATLNSVSNYGGIFTPHVQIFDEMNNRRLYIAPSGIVAGKYAENFEVFNPWEAVAGNTRGMLNVLGLYRTYTQGEQDVLYDNSINPIRYSTGSGVRIWGQRTLQTRPSDLDRMNARMTLLAIKPPIQEALESFLFNTLTLENDSSTRLQIRSIIENYLAGVKSRNGVYDYRVVCDDINNTASDIENNTLNVWVMVKLTKTIEYIPLTIGITANSMEFSLAGSLL